MDTVLPPELVDAARRVVEANKAAGRRVALAESCTGGLVCAALTEVPGSSDVLGCSADEQPTTSARRPARARQAFTARPCRP